MKENNNWLITKKELTSFLEDLKLTEYKLPAKGEKMYIMLVGQHFEVTKEGKSYRLNHFVNK